MFKEGRLLYFTPFFFRNGNPAKPKYFLVIKNLEDGLLLASLPTSQDHIPQGIDIKHGVCEIPTSCVSAYVFVAGEDVATAPDSSRFSFPKNTFIYGEQIEEYNESLFKQQIENGMTQVVIKGDLDQT